MFDLQAGVGGTDALKRQLEKLKKKASKEQLDRALVAGARVFKRAIVERTPERPDLRSGDALPPGAMKNDIHVKVRAGDEHSSLVTVGRGRLSVLDMARLEFGHAEISHSPTSRQVGTVPAHPVMRPAWEASKDEAMQAVIDSLREQEG